MPDTEYVFRAAAVNKPGQGVWSLKEIKVKSLQFYKEKYEFYKENCKKI